jgi:hypothetical protein
MAKYLFEVQQKNRLEQKGLLKRFSITCFGHQETVEEMRAEKAAKFKELKEKRGTLEYDEWFLTYRPGDKKQIKQKIEDLSVTKTKKTTPSCFGLNGLVKDGSRFWPPVCPIMINAMPITFIQSIHASRSRFIVPIR